VIYLAAATEQNEDCMDTIATPGSRSTPFRHCINRGHTLDAIGTTRSVVATMCRDARIDAMHVFGPSSVIESDDLCRLLQSFDTILSLHQRSEEIRACLETIDGILLKSRTVAGVIELVTAVLEKALDLIAVRILIRADHPMSALFTLSLPKGCGLIAGDVCGKESSSVDPFVLNDATGNLCRALLGEAATHVGSAVVGPLWLDNEELGLLCLASADGQRYVHDMDTSMVAELAKKIALGLMNAFEHENASRRMLRTGSGELFNEAFFLEYVTKEFNRAWRNPRPFSIMALSWSGTQPGHPSEEKVAAFLAGNIRSADVAAQGDAVRCWILLPDTDVSGAQHLASRLVDQATETFGTDLDLRAGITEFTTNAAVMPMLLDRAQFALARAEASEYDRIRIEAC